MVIIPGEVVVLYLKSTIYPGARKEIVVSVLTVGLCNFTVHEFGSRNGIASIESVNDKDGDKYVYTFFDLNHKPVVIDIVEIEKTNGSKLVGNFLK